MESTLATRAERAFFGLSSFAASAGLPAPFAPCPASAQPLLLIGKADAELSGAFSYEFLNSPLSHPFEGRPGPGEPQPPLQRLGPGPTASWATSPIPPWSIPELFARVSQHLNAHVDVSAPVFGGVVFFAARENASLTVSGALGNARFNLDTTLDGSGSVLLKGSIHMPLLFDMHWRSLSFGYAFKPRPGCHWASRCTSTSSPPAPPGICGRICRAASPWAGTRATPPSWWIIRTTRCTAPPTAAYEGKAWSPEMAVGVGPVRLVSRMGARMSAKGHLDVTYSVPYFIDPGTFEPRFTEPDSFLASDNLRRLLDGETGKRNIHIKDRLILMLPQSHTVSVDILPGRLSLSYTKVFGRSPSTWSPQARVRRRSGRAGRRGGGGQRFGWMPEGFVDLDLSPRSDDLPERALRMVPCADIGVHSLNMSYRRRKPPAFGPVAAGMGRGPHRAHPGFRIHLGAPAGVLHGFFRVAVAGGADRGQLCVLIPERSAK